MAIGEQKDIQWKAVTCLLRSEEKIVLTVAASGIAALLLPSGRTAHSRFQIPLNLKDECVCHIKKNSQLADLLRQTDLIIWDEAPMNDRRCFEALDRSLRDISNSPNTLFEGKSIMLGGDFRQTLPVKKKASKPEILDASITSSYLWPEFKTYMLMENMRLRQSKTTEAERLHIENFSSWLLSIGDGTIGDPDETDNENTFNVNMAHELCIPDSDTALASLINFIYDQKTLQMPTPKDLQKKVIVCPKNEHADMINAQVLSLVNRQQHVYLSLDEAMPHGNDGGETELLYPPEYLNSLNFAGFPPHRLELKVGAPIILLRNLNISGGLCNGTRLIVTQLLNKVIEARIITGTRISEKVFLPRIPLINRDLQLPFIFKRKQFPIKLCYAMTINKSQGQSLERIGIFLPQPVFAHGQFIMTEANNPNIIPMEKGKLPLVEANTVSLADIEPRQSIRVYRKWVAKNVRTQVASNFCAILLDKEGNAIQANMDLRDTDYFNDLLQLNNAYRISQFKCTTTKIWDHTLPNNTTLIFGRYTSIIPISNTDFPEHYFNFIAYNEVNQRADMNGAPLIATLLEIMAPNGWYYRKCNACNVKVSDNSDVSECHNHGPQPTPNYGYCFKAIIDDGTATATMTCFSPEAHTFVPDCNTILNTIEDKNANHVPPVLKEAEGHNHALHYVAPTHKVSSHRNFDTDILCEAQTLVQHTDEGLQPSTAYMSNAQIPQIP
ncbi:DNA helicase [Tanacetum coccineum]